jgi:hypothetical protein
MKLLTGSTFFFETLHLQSLRSDGKTCETIMTSITEEPIVLVDEMGMQMAKELTFGLDLQSFFSARI